MGRVFLYSAQKNFGGRLWSKAEPASLIPHLGLCKPNHSHEPGGGPEEEVLLKNQPGNPSSAAIRFTIT